MKSAGTQSNAKTNSNVISIEPKPPAMQTPTSQSHQVSTNHLMVNHAGAGHPPGGHLGSHPVGGGRTPDSHSQGHHTAGSHATVNQVPGGHTVGNHVAVAPHQKATAGAPSPPVAAPPPMATKGAAEDKVEVSTPPEAAMPYDKQGSETAQKPDAMTNGGAVTPRMTMLTASEPVRQMPQKAVVKPNVLTHVIEGYIIQEGPEPFPVSRSSLIAETESPKPAPDNDEKAENEQLQQVAQGKVTKKKKMGRKSWRKVQINHFNYTPEPWEPTGAKDDKNQSTEVSTEERPKEDVEMETATSGELPLKPESSVESPMPANEMEVDTPEPATPAAPCKNPRTWTVQEVADYIQELPGCTDYAEEFRSQEIDGQALLLLKEDHLMTAMNIKLGPALKICAKINSLREEQ